MKKHSWLFVILFLYVVLLFLPVIVDNEGVFLFYGDCYEQLYHYFVGSWQKLHLGKFGGFDFSVGLGANFLCTTFYSVTPFFLLMMCLPLAFVKYSFLYLTIIKIICIVVFTYLWMSELTQHMKSRIIGTFVFAFSGWVMFYMIVGFLDFFVFYPLVLYFTEKYLKKGLVAPLVISLAALCIMNYYFAYMFIPFLCMYTLYRYLMIHPVSIQKTCVEAVKFFGWVLLSVGLSAVSLLPNAYIILQEPRLENSLDLFAHVNRIDLFHLISSLVSPVVHRFNANMFVDESLHTFMGWNGGAPLFAGMIVVVLLPLILKMNNKKERNGLIIFYLVLTLFACCFAFYRLFQGTVESRWFFMFTAVHAICSVRVSEEIFENRIHSCWILAGLLFACALVFACLWYANRNQLFNQDAAINPVYFAAMMCMFAVLISAALMVKHKVQMIILLSVLMTENFVYFRLFLNNNPTMEASVVKDNVLLNRGAIELIENQDSDFYRIMYGTNESTTQNEPIAKAFSGTTFYSSLYNFAQEDYLQRLKSSWSSPQVYGRFKALNLLGTEYYLSSSYYQPMEWGYQYMDSYDDVTSIYHNPYSYGLGYATSRTINEDAVSNLSYFDQDRIMMNHIVTEDSPNTKWTYADTLIDLGEFTGDEILIQLDEHHWDFVLHLVYESGAQLNVIAYEILDWIKVGEHYFWQENYTSIYYDEHQYVKDIKVNLLDEDVSVVHAYLEKPQDSYPQMFEQIESQMFYDVSYDQNEVHAKIDVYEQDCVAFTNIPIDEGWEVWVDGQKVDVQKVNFGFIGFKLTEGTHEIEMKYSLPWFEAGLTVSGVSFLLFILLLYKRKKAN